MNWTALAETLGITTEHKPVYRAPKRGWMRCRGRLTKDAAIQDAVKGIARSIDQCDCDAEVPEDRYPGNYCGCRERIEEMVEVLTEVAKRLPKSAEEWRQKTSRDFWESYQFAKEDI